MSTVTTINLTQKGTAPAPASQPRISSEMLDKMDNVLKVAAGCAMYYLSPVETIKGALAGAIVCFMLNDDAAPRNECSSRANATASICFTGMTAAFAFAIPGTHVVVPMALGFYASSGGAYNIVRKFAN